MNRNKGECVVVPGEGGSVARLCDVTIIIYIIYGWMVREVNARVLK